MIEPPLDQWTPVLMTYLFNFLEELHQMPCFYADVSIAGPVHSDKCTHVFAERECLPDSETTLIKQLFDTLLRVPHCLLRVCGQFEEVL